MNPQCLPNQSSIVLAQKFICIFPYDSVEKPTFLANSFQTHIISFIKIIYLGHSSFLQSFLKTITKFL